MKADIMKKHATYEHAILARGSLPTVADGETAVLELPENSGPPDGSARDKLQIERLTPREIDVLQFVAKGKLNKQAASELCISIKTVEKHREHIMKKLGIRGIAGLTHFAIHAGIIPCNPWIAME